MKWNCVVDASWNDLKFFYNLFKYEAVLSLISASATRDEKGKNNSASLTTCTVYNLVNLWWKGMCSLTELSKVANGILNLPPTSASVERSFSCHSYIHSPDCNRLTTDRAAKLVFGHNLTLENIGNLPTKGTTFEKECMPSTSQGKAPAPVPLSLSHNAFSDSDTSQLDMMADEPSNNCNTES